MSYNSELLTIKPGESHLPLGFLGRDKSEIKLMVIDRNSGTIAADRFPSVTEYLSEGDLLVVNDSSILNASLPAYYPRLDEFGDLNIGTGRSGELVLVEPRPKSLNTKLKDGEPVEMTGTGKSVRLVSKNDYYRRYWWADFDMNDGGLRNLMDRVGRPITYDHVHIPLRKSDYNSIFSKVPGSVEPPSAAFPFTKKLRGSLVSKGVGIAYLTLHCNLGSLEPAEFEGKDKLLNESYAIPSRTIGEIARAKKSGHRVVALGTTVVRALESAWNKMSNEGLEHQESVFRNSNSPSGVHGETDLFIKTGYKLKVVDSILTGMHGGDSSHLDMISAFAGPEILESAYKLAIELDFLWHEFGDSTLIL